MQGADWNPAIPYHADRRAVMDRFGLALDHPAIRERIALLGEDPFAAMIVVHDEDGSAPGPAFVRERLRHFGLSGEPVYRDRLATVWARPAAVTGTVETR